ncbi:dTDP-4-amino-4,6-dideoxygalactose transaminase [Methyloceanibacter sp.]|uniref:dTDP-4-amino-4,6-dideoxygalactose transaminase n=1 Tax=Methyloceanibacter sp. TaxID=1965321 RepID=UPI003D6C7725
MTRIPFNSPPRASRELEYLGEVLRTRRISGGGKFTRACEVWLEAAIGAPRALLTTSCTAALEMAAMLSGVGPGDEIIMPSFTFPSTANAFVLRGATPVFVDIREDTLSIDEAAIEDAINGHTRAIVPMHYGGVGCNMSRIAETAKARGLVVIEDAAQALCARRDGRPLGSFGDFAALSFHESKNVVCGEGGALLINDPTHVDRAVIIRDKGTDRQKFMNRQVDKYSWVDIGSSYGPSEMLSAFLLAQLEEAEAITARRRAAWDRYHEMLEDMEEAGGLRRPIIPHAAEHNAHIYYVLMHDAEQQSRALSRLAELEIGATFHYFPLHQAAAGRRFGKVSGSLANTEELAPRLIRLPLYADITLDDQMRVVRALGLVLGRRKRPHNPLRAPRRRVLARRGS